MSSERFETNHRGYAYWATRPSSSAEAAEHLRQGQRVADLCQTAHPSASGASVLFALSRLVT